MRRRPVASLLVVTGISFVAAFVVTLGVMGLLPSQHHATFGQGAVPANPNTHPSAEAGTHQGSSGPTTTPSTASTGGGISGGGGSTGVPAVPAAGGRAPGTTAPPGGGSPPSTAPAPAPSPSATIEPGVVEVGVDVPAGTYTAHAAPLACSWKILQGGLLGTILDSALNVGGTQTVHLKVGETFDSQGCGTWRRS